MPLLGFELRTVQPVAQSLYRLRYGLDDPSFDSLQWQDICLLRNVQTGSRVGPAFYSVGTESSSPRVKRLELTVDHSPAIIAEVKNEWSYTPTPPICLHGLNMENLTFYYLINIGVYYILRSFLINVYILRRISCLVYTITLSHFSHFIRYAQRIQNVPVCLFVT